MIDFALREVTLDGQPVKLTPTEYDLVRNEGMVMPQRLPLQKPGARNTSAPVTSSYLKKYIQRLREKLKNDPGNRQMLLTECGVGYKFIRPR